MSNHSSFALETDRAAQIAAAENFQVSDRVRYKNSAPESLVGTVKEIDFRLPLPQIWVIWDDFGSTEVRPSVPYPPLDLVKIVEATSVSPLAMSEQEARQCIAQIKQHLNTIRLLLLELDERRGWEALGYESMRQCMLGEFTHSASQLHRELKAGKIERTLSPMGDNIGCIPERQLREIGKLPPEQWLPAWQEVIDTAPPKGVTVSHVADIVVKIRAKNQLTTGEVLKEIESFYKPGTLVDIHCPKSST